MDRQCLEWAPALGQVGLLRLGPWLGSHHQGHLLVLHLMVRLPLGLILQGCLQAWPLLLGALRAPFRWATSWQKTR